MQPEGELTSYFFWSLKVKGKRYTFFVNFFNTVTQKKTTDNADYMY